MCDETASRANDVTAAFGRLCGIIARLRGPGGCPWDREQNPASLRGDLIEETYECIEAIDEKDDDHIREELGDLFLLVTMLSYMHEQDNAFTIASVLDGVSEKLVRRHPHVFGETKVKNSAEVLDNWARIKVEQEGRAPRDSALDEAPRSLPPLDRAWKLQKLAARKGFDWPDIAGVIGKVKEELAETETETAALIRNTAYSSHLFSDAVNALQTNETAREKLEGELGDLLFSVVNLCRYLKVEPSVALQKTNAKFTARFKHVEKRMKETGREMNAENLPAMDGFWEEAKTQNA
jgi:tetrapyrrole methylase family protein/MazG family protein